MDAIAVALGSTDEHASGFVSPVAGSSRQSLSQLLRRMGHGRLRNFTPENRLVLRSIVTIAYNPDLLINDV
jgi:hypothetical protein